MMMSAASMATSVRVLPRAERQDGFYRYLLGSVSRAVDRLSASAALPAPLERIIEPDIPFPAYYFSWQQ